MSNRKQRKKSHGTTTRSAMEPVAVPPAPVIEPATTTIATGVFRDIRTWQFLVALLGLVVAVLALRDRRSAERDSAAKRVANVTHQLVVQPAFDSRIAGAAQRYVVSLFVMNEGPARAQQVISHLQLRTSGLSIVEPPRVTSEAPGATIQVLSRQPPGYYQIVADGLSPAAGYFLSAVVSVPDSMRERVAADWRENMFSDAFVRHFILSLDTFGENVSPRSSSAYPIPSRVLLTQR